MATTRTAFRWHVALSSAAFVAAVSVFAPPAGAEVTLVQKDGWTVFINGRMQTFFNYNKGEGMPRISDANGASVSVDGGGVGLEDGAVEILEGQDAATTRGTIEDLRIRTGFVGNVLGFGIKKQLNEDTEISGYSAVTVYIDSNQRRKYLEVFPDWRESYMRVTGPWGSVTAGRTLVLYSRGATEITYLYGYKYGLGWPGSISSLSGSGPGAGHVGFGVLGNGFGAGVAYATPNLAGAQLTVGLYDANSIRGSGIFERTKYPRAEGEITYEMQLGDIGMFKLFANGAYQKIYEISGYHEEAIRGVGYGGRVEVGPVHLGLAGHMGKGVGVNFALEGNPSIWHRNLPDKKFRKLDGYYAHLQVSPTKQFDIMAGAGITRVHLLDEDLYNTVDDDGDDPDGNGLIDTNADMIDDAPATPVQNDDANAAVADRVEYVPVKHQLGISGGVTYHISDNLHLAAEYFRASFVWHIPTPAPPGATSAEQNFDVVNLGVTYDF